MIRDEFEEVLIMSPPDRWARGHVTISLINPEEKHAIEAWRRGAFAVHELANGRASLTHAPTGLKIYIFDDMDKAAECAQAIEALTDWSAITGMMPAGGDLLPKVREIIFAIDRRCS